MITGAFNASYEAVIPLTVRGPKGQGQNVEAVIDTGFTGFLTLHSSLIALLGLAWLGREQAILGDGSIRLFDVYSATVIWNGQPRTVEVDAADTVSLVGMGLIYGYELRIQAVDGGSVTIEALR